MAISLKEAQKYFKKDCVKLEGLPVRVRVLDVRSVYDRIDALITTEPEDKKDPVKKWISADRLY